MEDDEFEGNEVLHREECEWDRFIVTFTLEKDIYDDGTDFVELFCEFYDEKTGKEIKLDYRTIDLLWGYINFLKSRLYDGRNKYPPLHRY